MFSLEVVVLASRLAALREGGALRMDGYAILVALESFHMGVATVVDSPHMDARREGLFR